jgi:hypothetical protein
MKEMYVLLPNFLSANPVHFHHYQDRSEVPSNATLIRSNDHGGNEQDHREGRFDRTAGYHHSP